MVLMYEPDNILIISAFSLSFIDSFAAITSMKNNKALKIRKQYSVNEHNRENEQERRQRYTMEFYLQF